MQDRVMEKAAALLESGVCTRVLGWKTGEFFYDVTPAVFTSAEEVRTQMVYNPFCGPNLSKYLIAESRKEGKIAVFLKPCDTFSFVQLQKEHRIARDKVYAVGVQCDGMIDMDSLKALGLRGVTAAREVGDNLIVSTLYGEKTVPRREALSLRCRVCKSKRLNDCDEIIGEQGGDLPSDRFAQVEALEAMTPEARSACSTTTPPASPKRPPPTALRRTCSTSSAPSTWQGAAPTAASAPGSAPRASPCIC